MQYKLKQNDNSVIILIFQPAYEFYLNYLYNTDANIEMHIENLYLKIKRNIVKSDNLKIRIESQTPMAMLYSSAIGILCSKDPKMPIQNITLEFDISYTNNLHDVYIPLKNLIQKETNIQIQYSINNGIYKTLFIKEPSSSELDYEANPTGLVLNAEERNRNQDNQEDRTEFFSYAPSTDESYFTSL